MILGRSARQAFSSWAESTKLALILLVVEPIVVKAVLLFNVLKSDPLLRYSGLVSPKGIGLRGIATIDPNIAFTSHALGTYAARSMLSGASPWWNPFEGVGVPLAGEMQAAALFPPTLLLILPNGQLLEHLLFQIIAGIATFLFVRRLGASVWASWFAGTAFCFNGTFAWLANAAVNPICFLPVVLLGVEWLRSGIRSQRLAGGLCISIGLAASLYAGFPETAYLDGLLISGWTIVRASQLRRNRRLAITFVARTGTFAIAGVLLSGPLLTAFFDYLMVANVGLHNRSGNFGGMHSTHAAMFLVPYLSGGISRDYIDFWGSTGGYAGIALFAFAIAGAAGRSQRGIRFFLLSWTFVALGAIYAIQPIPAVVALVPGLDSVMIDRYIVPSLLLALSTLASLALDDMWRDRFAIARMRHAYVGVVAAAACLSAITVAHGLHPVSMLEAVSVLLQASLIGFLAAVLFFKGIDPLRRSRWIAAIGALEIIVLFAVPMINYPIKRDLELGSVQFLQRNLGLQRFVATGPIELPGVMAANYGAYFRIAQVHWNDLPVPQAWVDYVQRHIDRQADPIVFRTSPDQFIKTVPAYAAIGTRYVTVPRATMLPRLTLAFEDALTRVYESPGRDPISPRRIAAWWLATGCG